MKGLDFYFHPHQDLVPPNESVMTPAVPLPESEDKGDSERGVNSSIIWCLSCLIKHIIEHPRTNDSHPITHESYGFGITTTWPRCGLTGLRYRVRVYPLFTAVTLLETAFPVACLGMWLSALPKTVGGKKMQLLQDYHTASVWLFWLNSWIYMNPSCISIWKPPHLCLAGGIFFVSSKCVLTGRLKCYLEKPSP